MEHTSTEQLLQKIKLLETENEFLRKQQVNINEAKDYYLKIFENFPALIWRAGLDKKCNYFNKTWLEFTGRSFEQEYGNGWAEGVHPDDFQNCLDTYTSHFDQRTPFAMEYRLKHNSGEYRWILDIGQPFFDLHNKFVGYIGSCYDITEKKDIIEQLENVNDTKNKFFAIIAHDLKSPLGGFLNLTEILKDQIYNIEENKKKELFEAMYKGTENILQLLSNLLLWSKSQTNNINYNPSLINVFEIANENILLLTNTADTKQVTIYNFINPSATTYADADMLKTIFRNLISNAIKFSNQQGEIQIMAEDKSNEMIFKVKDNGIGISSDNQAKIFSLTSKVSSKGTHGELGTGLGLILCKEFIELHQGKIWFESQHKSGSTFYFSIPKQKNPVGL